MPCHAAERIPARRLSNSISFELSNNTVLQLLQPLHEAERCHDQGRCRLPGLTKIRPREFFCAEQSQNFGALKEA